MDGTIPDKSYFRIGEVSKILQVEPYVLRYWESEFKSTIRPMRTKSDQRLYKRKDVEALMTIKRLLYDEEFTIKGAKRHLAKMKDGMKDGVDLPDSNTGKLLVEIKEGLLQIKNLVSRR
ncbi:MAG: MerR family transcriptional regulator [Deltaproteobacteria bacterium]|nr:MerR family transcriptional regulator [Deltaproteobacteria bacterium]